MEKRNGYYSEIQKGQIFDVDGELYELTDFRVTMVKSAKDFVTCAFFKSLKEDSKNPFFEERIARIIENPIFTKHKSK